MWSLLFAFCLSAADSSDDCVEYVVDPIRVVLLIDGSGSVKPDAFKNQVRLANSVLSSIRDMYSQNGKKETVPWQWALVQFATAVEVIQEMHVDAGPSDGIDESLTSMCSTGTGRGRCGTMYKPALTRARDVLAQSSGGHPFLWFLTDGRASDLSTPEKMRTFVSSGIFDALNITLGSVYLSPGSGSVEKAKNVLEALSCPDANSTCTDDVLVGHTSTDIDEFSRQAQLKFINVIERTVPKTCIAVLATALSIASILAVLAALAIAAFCCCGAVAVKNHFEEEEAGIGGQPALRAKYDTDSKRSPPVLVRGGASKVDIAAYPSRARHSKSRRPQTARRQGGS